MGIKERREREKEQRRNTIIDAAEKIIFAKGLEKATMDEVAKAAELSKGTVYLYFKSKEDLYMGIILRASYVLKEYFVHAIKAAGSGLEKVSSIGEAYGKFFQDHRDYFDALLYFDMCNLDDLSQDSEFGMACLTMHDEIFKLLINAIESGMKDGTIRRDIDPETLALILRAQSTGMLQLVAMKGAHLRDIHGVESTAVMANGHEIMRRALMPLPEDQNYHTNRNR